MQWLIRCCNGCMKGKGDKTSHILIAFSSALNPAVKSQNMLPQYSNAHNKIMPPTACSDTHRLPQSLAMRGVCLSLKFEKPDITPFSIRALWEPRGPLCRMLASMNNLYTPLSCSKLLAVSIIEMAGARFSLSQEEVNLYEVGFLRHLYRTSPRVLVWVWWYHVPVEESRAVTHKDIWHCHAQNA